jgi:hypothetical protein
MTLLHAARLQFCVTGIGFKDAARVVALDAVQLR